MFFSILLLVCISSVRAYGPYQDCTNNFKNRVASFEYNYYPSYWLCPKNRQYGIFDKYAVFIEHASVNSVKSTRKVQWLLHDCGSGSVCMESRKADWDDWYITFRRYYAQDLLVMKEDTNLKMGSNSKKKIQVWCKSCDPEPNSITYSDCQLRQEDDKVYTDEDGWGYHHSGNYIQSSNWYSWRIESPPTRQYWEKVINICNNGLTNSTYTHQIKSSITTSMSETNSMTVEAKISAGLEAGTLINMKMGIELSISNTYSRTRMTQAANERTLTMTKTVRPGKRWVVKQLIGEASFTTIRNYKFRENGSTAC